MDFTRGRSFLAGVEFLTNLTEYFQHEIFENGYFKQKLVFILKKNNFLLSREYIHTKGHRPRKCKSY